LETSTSARTNNEDAYNLEKEVQDDDTEKATESTDSHKNSESLTCDISSDKRDVKSMFPKAKLVDYTPAIETSILQPKEEKVFSTNDTDTKPSTRFRNFTCKLKSSMTLRGSSGKEIKQDKLADTLVETTCNLKIADSTQNTLLAPKTFSTKTNELHITEVEHGGRKRKKAQHNHSLVRVDDVSSERRKRRLNERGFEVDFNEVQNSNKRSRSSHHRGSSNTSTVQDNFSPLLRKGRKSSLSGNPEILAALTVTAAMGEVSVLNVADTSALLTSREASAVTEPVLTAVMSAGRSSKGSILPAKSHVLPELAKSPSDKSAKKDKISVQSCEKEDHSVSVNASADVFHKENISVEKLTSHERVITRQRSRCLSVNVNETLHGVRPRKLRSSVATLDEHIKDVIGFNTKDSVLKSMSSPQNSVTVHVPYLNTHKIVNSKHEASEHPEELDVHASKTVSNVVTSSQKRMSKENSMSKLHLKASLQCEDTSCFPESEVPLPCIETEKTRNGTEEVQTDSMKVSDSEDIIESSQDISASSLIVSRLPPMNRCSVSVCRIDTTLEPGAEIDLSQGDQKLMVSIPQDCYSPFKVYTPERKTPTATQQENPADAVSEMENTHHMIPLSATRSLYGKCADVSQMDPVQDEPNISLVINSSVPECMKVSAYKISLGNISATGNDILKRRSEKQTVASKCDVNISSVAKTDTAESKLRQGTGTSTSKGGIPVLDYVSESSSHEQIRMSGVDRNVDPPKRTTRRYNSLKSVRGVPHVENDAPRIRFKYQSKSKSEDSIAVLNENSTSESISKQQFDKPTPVNSILMAVKCDPLNLSPREQTDMLRPEDNISAAIMDDVANSRCKVSENGVSTVGEEDTPTHRSKQQINTSESQDNVTGTEKQDILKSQSEQQKEINMSLSDGNVPVVETEGTPKHQTKEQINMSGSQDSVPVVGKEGIVMSQSKQWVTSISEVNGLMVSAEYTPKLRFKQQTNPSKSDVDVSVVCREDGPQLRSKQRILSENVLTVGREDKPTLQCKQLTGTSKSEESVSKIGKEYILKSQCKKQVNTVVTNGNISIVDREDAPKLRSRQQFNTATSADKVSEICKRDTSKPRSEKQINISVSRDNVSASVNEDTAKRLSASECEDSVWKDVLKSQSKQQANTSVSEVNALMADSKDNPKPQSKRPLSQHNVSAGSNEDVTKHQTRRQINASKSGKEYTPKPRMKQQINTSKSKYNVSRVGEEDSPKPQSKDQVNVSLSECDISSAVSEDSPGRRSMQQINVSDFKDNILSSITESTQKIHSKEESTTSGSEGGVLITVKEVALKPKSKQQICAVGDITKSSSKCKGINRKVDQNSEVISDTEIQGSKMVLLSCSEKVMGETLCLEGKAQHVVMPKSVSMNHCRDKGKKKTEEDNESRLDHIPSSTDDSLKALTRQKFSEKGHFVANVSDINKALELNETNILKGDSKLSSPLQPCKRPASSSHMALEAPHVQVDSNIDDHVDMGVSKSKRFSHSSENVNEESICDRSPISSPSREKLCNSTSDSNKTPSPSSPKSLLSSPRSLLQAFSSPSGSLESNQTQQSHHKRLTGGRAHYMVGLAVAVNDVGTLKASSPVVSQKSEEIRSIISAMPPSLPLSRKEILYGMLDAGVESSLTRLER
jgi:hypothetical protein